MFRVQVFSNLSFLSFLLCFTFLSGCGDPHFFHFICVLHFFKGAGTFNSFISFVFYISFRVWGPSILSILSVHLCFSFLSGCRYPQIFHFFHFFCVLHFFQGAGILISFISFVFFISFRGWGCSFLSFLLCFTFFSGCRDPQFFHFICVFHFFQGVGLQFFHFFQGPHFFHFFRKISLGNISKFPK